MSLHIVGFHRTLLLGYTMINKNLIYKFHDVYSFSVKNCKTMSKRFKDIILCTCRIIICLLIATGCHRQAFTQQTVLSPDNQVFNESKDGSHQDDDKEEAQVILKINIIDNEHLEYVIINEGSEKAYYASEFYLEMYQEGKWVDVRNDVFGDISSTDVWTLLSSRETVSRNVRLAHPLQVGRYRLRQPIEKEDNGMHDVACIEFAMVEIQD